MSNAERPMLAGLRAELSQLSGDVQEMIALRWQLASLELHAALGQLKALVIALGIAAVLGLTSLPLVAVSAAQVLDGALGLSQAGWLLVFALVLLVLALLVGLLAWRTFRRRFVGLEETLEELHEDLRWVREK